MADLSLKLTAFEGPLDLLLHLIERDKVDIYDIPIAAVTEQYISYLRSMSEFDMEVDTVIMAIGTSPNPLIKSTTAGLEVNARGGIVVNEEGLTSRNAVYAGGDAVTGAATVISAMGAGKTAAKAIDGYLAGK